MAWSTKRKATFGIMISTAILLIAWDVFVYATGGTEETISSIFWWLGEHPIVPFVFGALSGHFGWTVYGKKKRRNR